MTFSLGDIKQPFNVAVVNPVTKPVPVTEGRVPYIIYYKQNVMLGSEYEQSFVLPRGKKFIIEYINASCQCGYKEKCIRLELTTKFGPSQDVKYNFVLRPLADNDFPSGLYRFSELTKIVAEQHLDIKVDIRNIRYTEELGDLLIAISGYVTETY